MKTSLTALMMLHVANGAWRTMFNFGIKLGG